MKRLLIMLSMIALVTSSFVYSFFSRDPGTNVIGSTATGALIGGLAGGGRGAGIGAAAGLGVGLLTSAASHRNRNNEIDREEQKEDKIDRLYDEHDQLMNENKSLVDKVNAAGMRADYFKSNLNQKFRSQDTEKNAVRSEIRQLKLDNRRLRRQLKR